MRNTTKKEKESEMTGGVYTYNQCQKCGAICTVGLLNPKTQLCTDCDEEYEPAERWWMNWKLKKNKK